MRQAPIIAKMAFRNVLKYGRRSAETFLVLFAGVAAMSVVDAFMNGFADRIVAEFAVASGHVRASAPGYEARRAICPLDKVVRDPDALAAAAEEAAFSAYGSVGRGARPPFSGVAAMPVIRAACAAQSGDRSVNLYAAGAEAELPSNGLAPPFRAARIVAGRFPAAGERGAALSESAASRLGASVGDPVVFLAADAYGSFGAVELPLLGIAAGNAGPEACLLDLASMRELVGVEEGASEVALYLVDDRGRCVDPRLAPEALAATATAVEAAGLEAGVWNEGGSPAAGLLAFFDSFVFVLYGIFALVAGSGIANSVLLSVQDRTRDFGTLRAVAFGPWAVKAIVALETAIVGAAASAAGAAAAWAVAAAIGPEGLILPEAVRGITDWMPVSIAARADPVALALIMAGGILLPLAAAAYPLHALGRMKIREALGFA